MKTFVITLFVGFWNILVHADSFSTGAATNTLPGIVILTNLGASASIKLPGDSLYHYTMIFGDGGTSLSNTVPFSGSMTDGAYNLFFGMGAGYSATTAHENTLIGPNAGFYLTAGASDVFIGAGAGQSTTDGSYNVMIGSDSGLHNTHGAANIFIGTSAGAANETGSYNTYLGYQAGETGVSAAGNFFGGYWAGLNNTGSYNTFLGFTSGRLNTSGANRIAVGALSGFYTTDSNTLFIDSLDRGSSDNEKAQSLIYGVIDASPASQQLTVNAGNVYLNGSVHTTNILLGTNVLSFNGTNLTWNGVAITVP